MISSVRAPEGAGLGQPRDADLQDASRFPRREKSNVRGRRFLLAPANQRLGSHC
jgi:hypothetical protein